MSRDLFHEAMLPEYGGRCDTGKMNPKLAKVFEAMRTLGNNTIAGARVTWPSLPPIHVDFANTDSVNAFAFQHRKHYFIGVTKGAVRTLALLFERMLSDRRILMNIGVLQNEIDHPPLSMPIQTALLQDNLRNGARAPVDPIRQTYCSWLIHTAFAFLLLHELGHIVNGHVDFDSRRRKAALISEFGSSVRSKRKAIDSHLKEIDADCFAANQGVYSLGHHVKSPPFPIGELGTYDGLLFAWLFGVFSFFRIFGDYPLTGTNLYTGTHPPLRWRVGFAWVYALEECRRQHAIPPFQLGPVVKGAASSTERAFRLLTGEPISPEERYIEAFGPATIDKDYFKCLSDRWNNKLRQKLLSCSYGGPMMFQCGDNGDSAI